MPGLLSIEGLRKGYARGGEWVPVCEGVSLEVVRGEVVAIVGGRLAGKTALLKVAAGIERAERGSVLLGGRLLVVLPDRAREVRWVDRDGPGLGVQVGEFVAWPLAVRGRGRRRAERAAAQMLERVGAGTVVAGAGASCRTGSGCLLG